MPSGAGDVTWSALQHALSQYDRLGSTLCLGGVFSDQTAFVASIDHHRQTTHTHTLTQRADNARHNRDGATLDCSDGCKPQGTGPRDRLTHRGRHDGMMGQTAGVTGDLYVWERSHKYRDPYSNHNRPSISPKVTKIITLAYKLKISNAYGSCCRV